MGGRALSSEGRGLGSQIAFSHQAEGRARLDHVGQEAGRQVGVDDDGRQGESRRRASHEVQSRGRRARASAGSRQREGGDELDAAREGGDEGRVDEGASVLEGGAEVERDLVRVDDHGEGGARNEPEENMLERASLRADSPRGLKETRFPSARFIEICPSGKMQSKLPE